MTGKPLFNSLRYCVRCCMPETEEGTSFDEFGICRACQSSEQKMHIDWDERHKALVAIFDKAKAKAKATGNYDCLLPISGGKDSMFQAYLLTQVFGLKPLAVTHNHNWYSETGWYNLMNLLETFNIDHFMFTPNRALVNKLAKISVEKLGDSCWHCHTGVETIPTRLAMKFNIPLVAYGESSSEAQGRATYKEPLKYDRDHFLEISAKIEWDKMLVDGITEQDLCMYRQATPEEYEQAGIMRLHLGDYMFWDDERHTEFVRDTFGWRETEIENCYKKYKSAECVMPGVHDFTCYLKRGFGRATFQACVDVRNGLLTREEGFNIIRDVDTVRPEALDYFLSITGMSEERFYKVMEGHRRKPLEKESFPIKEKKDPNPERIYPYPLQVIEKNKRPPRWLEVTRDESTRGQPIVPAPVTPSLFHEYSVNSIINAYQSGEFRPSDVAQACIDQVKQHEEYILAWEIMDAEHLLAQARESEKRLAKGNPCRPLEGIPVGVKDVFNTKDFPTQMGSPLWKDFRPGNDARIVFNMKRAGGLTAGKTVTAEFAVHAMGKTKNPHDVSRSPGTSSSGSVAAVATGMVPVALGSQTAGSIVRPASYCGVFGMKTFLWG